MKRITYFFIALLAAIVASCSGCDPKDTPAEDVRVLDFDSLITADYNYVDTLCGDSNFMFYESTAMFADSTMQISKVVSIFQRGDTVIQITHTPEEDIVDMFQDFVLEDCAISMPLTTTFVEALKLYQDSEFGSNVPRNVVLRRPLGPVEMNTLFIFGARGCGYVAVDTETKGVFPLNETVNEEEMLDSCCSVPVE